MPLCSLDGWFAHQRAAFVASMSACRHPQLHEGPQAVSAARPKFKRGATLRRPVDFVDLWMATATSACCPTPDDRCSVSGQSGRVTATLRG
jgi:hypothetical protein